jgi:predicted DNA-binding transcriptional regulator AlpA
MTKALKPIAPAAPTPVPVLIGAESVGQLIELSGRTVRRYRSMGKLPAPLKVGGAVRWRRQEILDWIAAGCPDRRTWEQMQAVRDGA